MHVDDALCRITMCLYYTCLVAAWVALCGHCCQLFSSGSASVVWLVVIALVGFYPDRFSRVPAQLRLKIELFNCNSVGLFSHRQLSQLA